MKDQYLIRDNKSGAVLNTDIDGLALYKARKGKETATQNRIASLENQVEKLSDDLDFIKKLLVEKLT